MVLKSETVVSGNFVKVYYEGEWMMDMTKLEVIDEFGYEDVPRSGTRRAGKKLMTVEGTGTAGGYKTSKRFTRLLQQNADDAQGSVVTELMFEVADPETPEANGFWRVKGVQFENNPIISAEPGSYVEQELNFTHQGVEEIEL